MLVQLNKELRVNANVENMTPTIVVETNMMSLRQMLKQNMNVGRKAMIMKVKIGT